MSLNAELADLFATLAALMELKGESLFKAIAFSKVSRILKDSTFDLREMVRENRLGEIEGVGASSQRIIQQYVTDGESEDFAQAKASVPAGLIPMLQIPGLGPKTIALFWKERGITSLEELVKAIDGGKLDGLKGVGEKKLAGIKQGIEMLAQAGQRRGIVEALPVAEALLKRLRELPQVKTAEIAGSLRRHKETVGDVDLVCAGHKEDDGAAVAKAFAAFPEVQRVLGQGITKASVVTADGLQVDLRIVPAVNYGAALMYFTGSKEHNTHLRGMAQEQSLTLNEWGLYKLADLEKAEKKTGQAPAAKPVASKSEEEIYKALGLAWIAPELREDRGEIAAAVAGKLPKLIELADIRGDLHLHTTASDGHNSIEEMAQAAAALGYQYLAITDHSKSSVIANGLSAERLIKHAAAIRQASDRLKGITLLAGCEVDILADGHLDFEDAVLAELDYVVASPHVALKQDEAKATDRLLKAMDNKYVNVIGHPTGRMIGRREGLPLQFARIFTAAVQSGTALEINASYPRLDLNDVHAKAAIAAGVMLSINTDAHAVASLPDMQYGVQVARRAWVESANVINCFDTKQLLAWIKRKRAH